MEKIDLWLVQITQGNDTGWRWYAVKRNRIQYDLTFQVDKALLACKNEPLLPLISYLSYEVYEPRRNMGLMIDLEDCLKAKLGYKFNSLTSIVDGNWKHSTSSKVVKCYRQIKKKEKKESDKERNRSRKD